MAFKFVLLLASVAYASAGYIPSDYSSLSYAPTVSYGNGYGNYGYGKNVAPILSKTILAEPQLYHGYAQAAPSVVVSKPLAIESPVSYAAPHGLYQAPTLVKNFEYSKPLSYGPIAKTIIAEPTYAKSFVSEPIYSKSIVSQPIYGKSIVSQPIYGKSIFAEPAYSKTIVSEPIYNKNVYAEPIYSGKALIAEPVYGKSILAQPSPVYYGGKVLSYAQTPAYGGISAHGW